MNKYSLRLLEAAECAPTGWGLSEFFIICGMSFYNPIWDNAYKVAYPQGRDTPYSKVIPYFQTLFALFAQLSDEEIEELLSLYRRDLV